MPEMPDALADAITAATPTMVALRHDLHEHPELSYDEHRTTAVITRRLEELGWWLEPCPTATGAVATMRGTEPGRSVMIRADIDALPVTELRDLPYRSTADGVMHACGHDVHAAALLGVAEALATMREGLAGDYTLVFQPAEEAIGGARALVEGGLLERHRPDVVIGAHVTSFAPVGVVATRPGVFMSEATSLRIEIAGRGGHGAMATREGSVVLAAAELAPRVGAIVEGLETEGTACACSIGVIHAGTKNNVVPRAARLEGTLRTFTPEQRATALSRLDVLLDDVARDFAVTCELFIDFSAPATVNDAGVTARVVESARQVVGGDAVLEVAPVTPSEDVSELLNRVAGCYLFVGGALDDGTSGPHHSPEFAVDDRAVAIQAHVLARAALDLAVP
jgi:amidohydrolase